MNQKGMGIMMESKEQTQATEIPETKPVFDKSRFSKKQIFTIPNLLSVVRLLLIIPLVWLYCGMEEYVLAGVVLILSGVTDVVDGFIARHFHMISDIGKVLDPIADKLTQGAMMLCLVFRFPLMTLPLVLLIVKELFMLVIGYFVIKKSGNVPCANWHGKVATCLLYAMMVLHIFWVKIPVVVSHVSIVICTAMIALSFVLYTAGRILVLCKKEDR